MIMKKITFYYSIVLFWGITIGFAQNNSNCWTMLSAGGGHVVAINQEGSLFTWGKNDFGQTGTGFGSGTQTTPQGVRANIKFSYVAAALNRSYAISTTGILFGCGNYARGNQTIANTFEVVGGIDWKSVYAAERHTLGLKTNGTLWGFGANSDGTMGNKYVSGSPPEQIGTDTNWQTVAAAYQFTLALKTDGTMWSWGRNYDGMLGIGNTTDWFAPRQIGTDTNWANISAQNNFSLALKKDGTLWAWGNNSTYQLGNGTTTSSAIPIQIGSDNDWTFIIAASNYAIALKSSGTLWAWGKGENGVMGNNTKNDVLVPTQIGSDTNWKSVSAAFSYVMATKTDGSLWAWGSNLHSNFGNGNTTDSLIPILVGGCSLLNTKEWNTNSFTVYPNPSSGTFNINSNVAIENVAIKVSDLNGRIVYQSKVETLQNTKLVLNQLQSGIYILNVSNGSYNYAQKLVKQ